MLTPAISVISAIEGLQMISPKFEIVIVPLACAIMLALFSVQSKGSGIIGKMFWPLILAWFLIIAALGFFKIVENPIILAAVHPYYAFEFFRLNGLTGFFLLGGVFLVMTGGEALYADIGHFGKNPIRLSWFCVVLPSLLLNYFGQGADLLLHPQHISNPFYAIAPSWFFIPLMVISTMATIIASQALITATFSLTRQAVLLGLYPHLPIIQTSKDRYGQIYIPQMNFFLLIGTLTLILIFKNSSALTHAYGIAVNLTMFMVTIMVAYAAIKVWKWSLSRTLLIFSGFIIVEGLFLLANSHKFLTGGWVPISFALLVAVIMFTWNKGLRYLQTNFYMKKTDINKMLHQLHKGTLKPLHGMTDIPNEIHANDEALQSVFDNLVEWAPAFRQIREDAKVAA